MEEKLDKIIQLLEELNSKFEPVKKFDISKYELLNSIAESLDDNDKMNFIENIKKLFANSQG